MPESDENLQVIVTGAFTEKCCASQLFRLKEEGYNARYHCTANLYGSNSGTELLFNHYLLKYPDFFEGLHPDFVKEILDHRTQDRHT
jgi:hypothetical protein